MLHRLPPDPKHLSQLSQARVAADTNKKIDELSVKTEISEMKIENATYIEPVKKDKKMCKKTHLYSFVF